MVAPLELAPTQPSRLRAMLALVATCALWAVSFPAMKTLGLHASALDPGVSTWFVASATLIVRFGLAAALLTFFGLRRPTRSEWRQGLVMGLFTGTGMLFQVDALSFTSVSTSAFLTQGYIVILPLVVAFSARTLPSLKIALCVLTIAAGLALLSGFDWSRLRLGRGETETLLAALCFAFQILCLDHESYRLNRTHVVSILMFACVAILLVPVAVLTARSATDARLLFATPIAAGLVLVLSVPCTTLAFSLMNRYQPEVSASEAGIIYGAEPLFASLFALFLPGFFAPLAGVAYLNEQLTDRLLVGGGLVITANVLLQLPFGSARARAPEA